MQINSDVKPRGQVSASMGLEDKFSGLGLGLGIPWPRPRPQTVRPWPRSRVSASPVTNQHMLIKYFQNPNVITLLI